MLECGVNPNRKFTTIFLWLATNFYDDTTGGNKGIGQRTSLIDSSGTTTWFFARNAQAQPVVTATQSITGAPQSYTSTATSDTFGRPLTQTYPSGEVLTYAYNNMGALNSLSTSLGGNYVSNIDYNAAGQATLVQLGNNVITTNTYNANSLRLTSSVSGLSGQSPRLNLSYQYFANGNIQQITDATRSETLTYAYDDLDRLLSVGGAYSQSFAYTGNDGKIGNLTSKAGVTQAYTAQSASCPSGALSKPHAVTSTSVGSDSYCYDANGNMEKRPEGGITYNQVFDAENRLTHVYDITSGSPGTLLASFIYGGAGRSAGGRSRGLAGGQAGRLVANRLQRGSGVRGLQLGLFGEEGHHAPA